MGKTALALYMKHHINDDYGRSYFDGTLKFFCTYVSFQQQLKTRIPFLLKEAFRGLLRDGIFDHVSETVPKGQLEMAGVSTDFAKAIAEKHVRKYLESMSRYSLDEMATQWDSGFITKLPNLFFSQTLRAFKAAGFRGGLLVIDDLENLTDTSRQSEIEDFVKNLGLAFFGLPFGGTDKGFYTLIFTAHQQSAMKMSRAWEAVGLSERYPISPRGNASILTRKPDMEQCLDMVAQYIAFSRTRKYPDLFFPFTKAAIESIIRDSNFHPRKFLSELGRVIIFGLENAEERITTSLLGRIRECDSGLSHDTRDLQP
jgi:hypothetical protein